MKTTLIYPIRYRFNSTPSTYLPGDNEFEIYDPEPVLYPIDHVITGLVDTASEIEVILVQTCSESRNTDDYVEEAKKEIGNKLESHSRKINFKTIRTPFASTRAELSEAYKKIRDSISPNSNISADLTYGPKYMPLIMFCILNYAEKYLNCEIQKIYYGFFEGKKECPSYIVDFTTLYLLNSFGIMFDGSKSSFDSFAENILK